MQLLTSFCYCIVAMVICSCAAGLIGESNPQRHGGENRIEDWRLRFVLSPDWTFSGVTEEQEVIYYLYIRETETDNFHNPITGAITIAFQRIDAAPEIPAWGEAPWHFVQDSVIRFQEHAIEVMSGRIDGRPSGADNLHTLALALAAYEAAGNGITIDMTNWSET